MSAVPLRALDATTVRRWALRSRDALAEARAEIDALNVYPVPDGDTGTNLHLTVQAAVEALDDRPEVPDAAGGSAALAHGALLGARGNSGVILSQLLRGFADALAAGGEAAAGPVGVARAMHAAAAAAYAAVAEPVEGTMLTVAREAAAAAEAAADDGGDLAAVVEAAAVEAAAALARTPDQLEVLGRAGVVDAGGRGICVVLDALREVVTGTAPSGPPVVPARPAGAGTPAPGPAGGAAPTQAEEDSGGPAYEVMFLLEATTEAVTGLRERLAALGDSLVVVGGEPTWNVHVHVDDAGAAVEAGIEAGRPYRVRVTSFAETTRAAARSLPAAGRGVVTVVAGDGLAALCATAGATVVRGGPGCRASTAELLDGLRRAGARDLVVLPNDADSLAVAEAAAAQARDDGLRVAVIPTRATVQSLAALAVHDPQRRFEDDVVAMTAAAGHCRHGGVTVAAREAVTMAGVCGPGDVLGIVDGDFVVIGEDLAAVACDVLDRMLGSGGEMVTLVTGVHTEPGLAAEVAAHVHRTRPEVDTQVYEGGQSRYPLLIGVE